MRIEYNIVLRLSCSLNKCMPGGYLILTIFGFRKTYLTSRGDGLYIMGYVLN